MHRYSVRYIEREGNTGKITVVANSKGETRRIAEERGCDDILKVRRIGWPIGMIIVILLLVAVAVYLAGWCG